MTLGELADMVDRWALELTPYLPPSIAGSIIGLRWAKEQTPLQKVGSFCASCAIAVYAGPAIGEVMGLGPRAQAATILLVAVLGMDILGGIVVAAKQFGATPVASLKVWWTAWRGGGA